MASDTGQKTTATTTGQKCEFSASVDDERVEFVAHPETDECSTHKTRVPLGGPQRRPSRQSSEHRLRAHLWACISQLHLCGVQVASRLPRNVDPSLKEEKS